SPFAFSARRSWWSASLVSFPCFSLFLSRPYRFVGGEKSRAKARRRDGPRSGSARSRAHEDRPAARQRERSPSAGEPLRTESRARSESREPLPGDAGPAAATHAPFLERSCNSKPSGGPIGPEGGQPVPAVE